MPHKEDKPFQSVDLPGFVGFANLPNQIHRNAVKKGFEFTLMVAGESGTGKSTLIDSLFLTDIYKDREDVSAANMISRTTEIQKRSIDIEERGVKLRLHVVDTPGFGEALCSHDCYLSVVQYIDEQFERFLNEESGLNRRNLRDTRVHCLFYFIAPHQRGLKPLDVAFLRAVHSKVNIVPLIAKADTLTKKELTVLKAAIRDDIAEKGIRIYEIPDCSDDEDEDYKTQCAAIRSAMPFAVVGANTIVSDQKGRRIRGRKYEFGFVEVDNPDHCDFMKLRTLLVTHMQDLQEVTHDVLYENFRAAKLSSLANVDSNANVNSGDVHVFRKPSGELTAVTNFSLCSEGNVSQHSMGTNVEVERQLMEKEAELRRMKELLAKLQQGGTATNLVTSGSSVSTSNLTAPRSNVPHSYSSGSSATLNAANGAMRYSMMRAPPTASDEGTSVSTSSGSGRCTPTPSTVDSLHAQPQTQSETSRGVRGTNAYASFNVSHSYTVPGQKDLGMASNLDYADGDGGSVTRQAGGLGLGLSLLSRTASLMPVKKPPPPPTVPRTGLLSRKIANDSSVGVTVTKDFVL